MKAPKDTFVVDHLKMIQNVIDRLGDASFMVKYCSLGLLALSTFVLLAVRPAHLLWAWAPLLPAGLLWGLDAYYLWMERLFRADYDRVRRSAATDFAMNPMQHSAGIRWGSAFASVTLVVFYGIECGFILLTGVYLVR